LADELILSNVISVVRPSCAGFVATDLEDVVLAGD
jgi:hypothetical protein